MDIINKIESRQKGYITGDAGLDIIKGLASSQGCWGRMLRNLIESDAIDDFKDWVEKQQFKTELDLILCLEGN